MGQNPVGGPFQRRHAGRETRADPGEIRSPAQVIGGLRQFGAKAAHRFAAIPGDLAANQIDSLDTVGALVDRGDAGVAIVLGRAGLLDEAHAAVHLHAHGGDLDAYVSRPGLGDGGQQLGPRLGRISLCLAVGMPGDVGQDARGQADRARRLSLGLHQHQGAAHVGVAIDHAVGVPGCAALLALLAESKRLLERPLGDGDALDAHLQACGVHHDEHVRQALAQLADQFGPRALIEHHAGGRAVDTQLVLNGSCPEVVARPKISIRVQEVFRSQEQADALDPGRRVGRARDDEMADIVGRVVIAPRDENLLTGDQPAALAVRAGHGGERGEVRPGLRLGQAHGAGPFAADQLGQHKAFLPLGPVLGQGLDRALGQHRAKAERHVGGVHHLEYGQLHGFGQALAAMRRVGAERVPAVGDERPVGVGEARRGRHHAIRVLCAHGVAPAVQRRQHI